MPKRAKDNKGCVPEQTFSNTCYLKRLAKSTIKKDKCVLIPYYFDMKPCKPFKRNRQ